MCRRITGAAADADDATQEALLRIVRGLDRFDGRSSFSTWAYRIATNASLDELRRRRRRPVLLRDDDRDRDHRADDPGGPLARTVDPLAQRRVEAAVDALAIDAAMANLPEEYRVAVVLRDVADLDYEEIALILEVPLGTVKSRIARGRVRLVRELTDDDRDPTGNPDPPDERPTS